MNIIAHCDYTSLAVAGFSTEYTRSDSNNGHLSFIVYSIDPLLFAQAIEGCLEQRNNQETYFNTQEVVLKASRSYDTIRIVRECTSLSITRGNMKVLFHGCVDVLSTLPKIIRKAVEKRDTMNELS